MVDVAAAADSAATIKEIYKEDWKCPATDFKHKCTCNLEERCHNNKKEQDERRTD